MHFIADRLPGHAELKDKVKRALRTSGVPCPLEPPGLSKHDRRKPDGITTFANKHESPYAWTVFV